jgi:DNA-binding NarL/FixJ family response regulator
MIRVMIVSKHAELRDRIAAILNQWPDFDVCARNRDSYDALYSARAFLPHVALVDEEPSLLDCPGLVSALKRWSPETRTIVLASPPPGRTVLASIACGAAGYLLKGRDADIIPAVIWVHHGGALMTAEAASRAFRQKAPAAAPALPGKPDFKITRTELGLLTRIGRGLSDKEIAAELRLRHGTVRNRVSALLRKTGLRSRTEIALFVHRAGILGDERKGDFPPDTAPSPSRG